MRIRKIFSLSGLILILILVAFVLPSVFAYTLHQQKGLTQWNKAKAEKGFIICRIKMGKARKTVLIDINGNIVHMWDGAGQEMLPPKMANGEKGCVLITVGSKYQERDWNNKVVWEWDAKDVRGHHDWQKLPNGNYLILGQVDIPENKIPKEFFGAGIYGKAPVKLTDKMYGDRILEITPEGKIVWQWFAHEHLNLEWASNAKTWFNRQGRLEKGDWSHFNSIHYCTNEGYEDKILVSNRHQNTVIMIDKKTADLVWTWGEDILGHQHDVQMIDPGLPGEGNVLIMDNGFGSKFLDTAVSTVFEVDPKTNKIVWYFYGVDPRRGSFRSWHLSGCQRLPNGNTLITEGETGRIFEVTPEKEIVWEYINPTNNDIFKARKVPPSWVPEIKLTPNLAEAAKLMAEAQAYYSAARKMVDQANKFLEYEIVK